MPSCGCNNSSDSCIPNNNVVGQAIIPITYNNCLGNSGEASDCPVNFQPSTPTTGACVTIPAVGATFNLPLLCNASKFSIGQWIQFATFGKYPVVGINSVTNLLTLRNSCADGTTAIAGNPDPGTQICGPNNIWLTGDDPCLDAEAFCAGVKECMESISDDNPLCTPDFPVTTDAECVFPMGMTSSCDAGDCPQPDDPLCWKVNKNLRICKDTICWPDGLAMAGEDEVVRSVGITEDGCLRESGGGAFFSLRQKLTDRSETNETGAVIATTMTFALDLEDYGVPVSAVAASIRLFYIYQPDESENQGLYFSTYLRGAAEAVHSTGACVYDTVFAINLGGSDQVPDAVGGIMVPLTPTDKTIYHEWQDLGSVGNDNDFRMCVYIDGYYA